MAKNNVSIDENVKEILDNLDKNKNMTSDELNKLKKEIENSLNFDEVIDNVDIGGNDDRVIFTDGEEQLVYEDGEFFIESTTDSSQDKKKMKRSDARNMYIEYFIKYQLNPILKQKQLNEVTKIIAKEDKNIEKNKEKERPKIKDEIKKSNKTIPDTESQKVQKKTMDNPTKTR